jgi:hypothetical protein
MNSLDEYFSNHINITNNTKDRIKTTILFNSYSNWKKSLAKFKNEIHVNQTSFNSYVNKLGIKKRDSNGKRFFDGVSFKSEEIIKPSSDLKETVIPSVPIIKSPIEIVKSPIEIVKSYIEIVKSPIVKKKFHDNFIKFRDFSLHVPSYIAVKGNLPSDIVYLFENPFDLDSALKLLVSKRTDLNNTDKARLYLNDILSFKNLSPDISSYLIFSTGLQYSRSLFHRDLLLCDTYDEFYSYCNNNPVLTK